MTRGNKIELVFPKILMRVDHVVFGGRYYRWGRSGYFVTHVDGADKREADDLDFMYTTSCSRACNAWFT